MARKKDSRSRINKRRNRRIRARKGKLLGLFHGQAESLEKREMLAGDVLDALQSEDQHSGSLLSSSELTAPPLSLPAPPPAVKFAGSLTSTETIELDASYVSLDVTGIDDNLIVTVQKQPNGKNAIKLQKMGASGAGEGNIVTYKVANDGSLDNLVAGRQNRKTKIILDGKLSLLEVTKASDLQIAIAQKATQAELLTKATSIEVIAKSNGEIETLEVGESGAVADVELLLGKDVRIQKLKKNASFSGEVRLHYPDANASTRPGKVN